MAPAQVMDLSQTQSSYAHKKFQVNRYAHKKFGTRPVSPELQQTLFSESVTTIVNETTPTADSNNKKISSATNIFRPYALGENTPRKRKHQELDNNEAEDLSSHQPHKVTIINDTQIFPATSSPQAPVVPLALPMGWAAVPPPLTYRLQQYQFDAQTLAIILQKQQAALSMGEMLKRELNFNLDNVVGM